MARSATVRLNVEIADGVADAQRLEASLEEIGVAGLQAGDQVERGAQQSQTALLQQAQAAERASAATRSMGRSAGTANQFATELGQASQDAAFGIQNVANQLPLLQEQFGRLRQQTGSTTAALRAVAGSLAGPAGIIAGISLLLTFQDQIVNFFSSAEQSASDAKEAINEVADAITEFESFEVAGVRVGPEDVEPTIRTLRTELQRIQTERELINEEIAEVRGTVADPMEATRRINALQEELATLDTREQKVTSFIDKLETQRGEYKQALDLRRLITENTDLAVNEQENETDAVREMNSVLQGAIDKTQKIAEEWRALNTDLEGSPSSVTQRRRFNRALERQIELIKRRRRLQRRGVEEVATRTRPAPAAAPATGTPLQGQVGQLVGQVSDVVSGGDTEDQPGVLQGISQTVEQLQESFDLSEKEAEQFKQSAEQQMVSLIQTATQLGTTLVQAFQKGEVSAQQMIATVLSGIGTILGRTGNPLLGAGVSGVGGIVGALQHGGTVNTPLQIVGERGPELAALPQGTQVHSNEESRRMMGTDQLIQEVRSLRGALRTMQVNMSTSEAEDSLNELQSEERRQGLREYTPTG